MSSKPNPKPRKVQIAQPPQVKSTLLSKPTEHTKDIGKKVARNAKLNPEGPTVRRENYKKVAVKDPSESNYQMPSVRRTVGGGSHKRSKANAPTTKKYKDFRKYLTKGGVMRTLIKLLTELFEQDPPPKNIRQYIIEKLANGEPLVEEAYQEMRTRLRGIHCEILDIEEELEQLQEVTKLYMEADQESNTEDAKQN